MITGKSRKRGVSAQPPSNGCVMRDTSGASRAWSGFTPRALTAKGLETLKVCPAALDTRQNAGEALTDAVKKGSLEVAVRLATVALTEGFRVLTKI